MPPCKPRFEIDESDDLDLVDLCNRGLKHYQDVKRLVLEKKPKKYHPEAGGYRTAYTESFFSEGGHWCKLIIVYKITRDPRYAPNKRDVLESGRVLIKQTRILLAQNK